MFNLCPENEGNIFVMIRHLYDKSSTMKDQSDEFRMQDGETDSGIEGLSWVSQDKQRTRKVLHVRVTGERG